MSSSRDLSDWNEYVFPGEMSQQQREEYGRILSSVEDDEWMAAQKQRSVLGSERFMQALKAQGGRFRRKRGKPVRRVNKRITR